MREVAQLTENDLQSFFQSEKFITATDKCIHKSSTRDSNRLHRTCTSEADVVL